MIIDTSMNKSTDMMNQLPLRLTSGDLAGCETVAIILQDGRFSVSRKTIPMWKRMQV